MPGDRVADAVHGGAAGALGRVCTRGPGGDSDEADRQEGALGEDPDCEDDVNRREGVTDVHRKKQAAIEKTINREADSRQRARAAKGGRLVGGLKTEVIPTSSERREVDV